VSPYFVSSVIPNMAACEVAIDLGVHGPVTASALACASGIYAFLEGRRLIASGEADVVVCGGTDASITPVMFAGLSVLESAQHARRRGANVYANVAGGALTSDAFHVSAPEPARLRKPSGKASGWACAAGGQAPGPGRRPRPTQSGRGSRRGPPSSGRGPGR